MPRRRIILRERIVFYNERTGENNSIDTDKPDDLNLATKNKALEYMLDETSFNQYPKFKIDQTESSIYDQNGNSDVFIDSNASTDNNFYQDYLRKSENRIALNQLEQYSHSNKLDIDSDIFEIKKKLSDIDKDNMLDIVTDIDKNKDNSKFVKRVRKIAELNSINSFNKQYLDSNGVIDTKSEDQLDVAFVQKELGVHNINQNLDNKIKLGDLKKLGLWTLFNASGEYVIPENPLDGSATYTAMAPGLARLGQRINTSRFRPVNVYKQQNPNFTKPSSNSYAEGDVLSYGNVNNFAVRFHGYENKANIALASMFLITIGGLIKAISAIGNLSSNTEPNTPQEYLGPQKRFERLGRHIIPPETSLFSDAVRRIGLGIKTVDTEYPFYECLNRGLMIFSNLGSTKDLNIGQTLGSLLAANIISIVGESPDPVSQNHGFYITVLRNIIRNATFFISQTTDLISGIANDNPDLNGEQDISGTNPVGSVINVIRESKFFKFINILAQIGNIAFMMESNGVDPTQESFIDSIKDFSPYGFALNPANLQAKSRLQDGTLAFKQSSAKSLYILPTGYKNAINAIPETGRLFHGTTYTEFDRLQNNSDLIDNKRKDIIVEEPRDLINGNRISKEIVEKMERYLEADYLPFYFHDIRTNEIISFHAFLENISDSFDAEYQEETGFGRVDKIKIYKSTNRIINLSFRLMASNEQDFDNMWFKINKLITLVYPQWSKGREINFGNNKFIQAFSQIPSASPMIRMRVGDLIKSNYSKLNLARLFGISQNADEFKFERFNTDNSGEISVESYTLINNKISILTDRIQTNNYEPGDHLVLLPNTNRNPYIREDQITVNPRTRNRTPRRATGQSATEDPNRLVINSPTNIQVVRTINNASSDLNFGGPDGFTVIRLLNNTREGNFRVPNRSLNIDRAWISRTAFEEFARERNSTNPNESQNSSANTNQEIIQSFLSNDNPIFKSFDSTKGKGLAGFIKSLKFDFANTTWEVNRFNSRAPKMLKIDIDFLPIHDLAPGIDHNGFNSAPIYNIGEVMAGQFYNSENEYSTEKILYNSYLNKAFSSR